MESDAERIHQDLTGFSETEEALSHCFAPCRDPRTLPPVPFAPTMPMKISGMKK